MKLKTLYSKLRKLSDDYCYVQAKRTHYHAFCFFSYENVMYARYLANDNGFKCEQRSNRGFYELIFIDWTNL